MDEADQKRQLIDEQTEGTGRLRSGVEYARAGVDHARLAVESARLRFERGRASTGRGSTGGARDAVEDGVWFLRRRLAWPIEDSVGRLGPRGTIGVFGGGGIALAGVVAALLISSSGGASSAGTTEAFVAPHRLPPPAPAAAVPSPTPKPKAARPTGPTLHGAPPDFSPAKDVRAGVGEGKAVSKKPQATERPGEETPAPRGASKSGNDGSAATTKIGATPAASASAQAQASSLAETGSGVAESSGGGETAAAEGSEAAEPSGPPAPKAAKLVARRFAEAFVVYEVGGVEDKVRQAFARTTTRQLSRSLLRRPPRQPANVKVPRAKVVNVVAGPSRGSVYTLSVSLLRVGVTSELRLEMEQGVGKQWEVTNVLG